jgi:hypothetical protein
VRKSLTPPPLPPPRVASLFLKAKELHFFEERVLVLALE